MQWKNCPKFEKKGKLIFMTVEEFKEYERLERERCKKEYDEEHKGRLRCDDCSCTWENCALYFPGSSCNYEG